MFGRAVRPRDSSDVAGLDLGNRLGSPRFQLGPTPDCFGLIDNLIGNVEHNDQHFRLAVPATERRSVLRSACPGDPAPGAPSRGRRAESIMCRTKKPCGQRWSDREGDNELDGRSFASFAAELTS